MTDLTHSEVEELIPLFALDALEPDEADAVAEAVRVNPRLRFELNSYHETLAMLAAGDGAAEGWDRIKAELAPAAPPLRLVVDDGPGHDAPAGANHVRPVRRPRPWAAGLVAAAVTAVAMLGVQGLRQSSQVDDLRTALGEDGMRQVARLAFADPDASTHNVTSPDGRIVADLAVGEELDAYLVTRPDGFPDLDGFTYQLWGFVGDEHRSLAIMGPSPQVVALQVPKGVTRFAVTIEPANGSVGPTGPVVGEIA